LPDIPRFPVNHEKDCSGAVAQAGGSTLLAARPYSVMQNGKLGMEISVVAINVTKSLAGNPR